MDGGRPAEGSEHSEWNGRRGASVQRCTEGGCPMMPPRRRAGPRHHLQPWAMPDHGRHPSRGSVPGAEARVGEPFALGSGRYAPRLPTAGVPCGSLFQGRCSHSGLLLDQLI